jgi:hypothetical protein
MIALSRICQRPEDGLSIWDRGRLRHSVGIETKGGRFTPADPEGSATSRLGDRDLYDG